jgi:hypothetical protein
MIATTILLNGTRTLGTCFGLLLGPRIESRIGFTVELLPRLVLRA